MLFFAQPGAGPSFLGVILLSSLQDFLRPLGCCNLAVAPLGLGTVKLGRNEGVKYPTGFQLPTDSEARNLLDLARDLGINLLDTAPAYGHSERRLGQLLGARRQEWIIVTKVGEEFSRGLSYFDFSAQHTRRSVERSLQRLNTDYLEVVLVHSDGNDLDILQQTDVYPTLERLKEEGKILAYGFSGKTVEGNLLALQQGDCAMVTYNLNERQELAVIEQAQQHQRGILVKKGLASGHTCFQKGEALLRQSFELLLRQPGISSAIIGTINPLHLQQNVSLALSVLKPPT